MIDWAGTDEWIDEDVQANGRGDMAVLTDEANVDAAMIRRLNTAKGDLFYDPNYGNAIHDKLSDPITNRWLLEATEDVRECLSWERRVTVDSIEPIAAPEQRLVRFRILYRYNNGNSGQLAWEVKVSG